MKLGEVVSISPSKHRKVCESNWLLNLDMVEQQTGRILSYNYVGAEELNGSIIEFDTGNVLYSKLRPNLNKVVIPELSGFATSEMLPLRPNNGILDRNYLAIYLRSDEFVTWAVSKTAGAKMPRLGTKELLGKEIPLPSIEAQKKIAELFIRMQNLIEERKQQLEKLDELVKARFVEMFGDVKTNSQSWTECRIDQACSMVVDCVNKTAPTVDYETPYKMIRTSNVKKGRVDTDAVKYVEKDIFEKWTRRVVPQKGDIILTREAPMGEVGIVDTDEMVFLGQRLVLYRVDPRLMNAKYLMYLLMSDYFQEQVISKGKGSTVKHLPVPDCTEFRVLVPDIELQQRFAVFVEQTDKSKAEIKKSLEALEMLKKALMQKYFG